MKGLVRRKDVRSVRFAVETDMGFTVFDVVSGEINVGDFVSGPLNDHGDAVLKNLTTGERIEVYVEAIQATQSAARDLLS